MFAPSIRALSSTALSLASDMLTCGVSQQDLQPRNVILRPQQHVLQSVSGTRLCETKECLVALEVDCDDLHMVMVDFEMVEFKEPDTGSSDSEEAAETTYIEKIKAMYLERWLENGLD